jgi:hypothetical protein
MSVSIEKSHDVKSLPTWDLAVEESVRQLQACEARASQLRVCLDYFHKRMQSGDPFPGIEVLKKKGLFIDAETPTTQN